MELLGLIAILALYCIPTFVGWNKKNVGAIFMLNLFLGWTVIGWFIALIWAFTVDDPEPVQVVQKEIKIPEDRLDKLNRLKGLLDRGAIDIGEYETEKKRILDSD